MDTQMMEYLAVKYPRGDLVNEGKTKRIWQVNGNAGLVILDSKNDITAGNGAKHDVIPAKRWHANTTACNVFRLLMAHGIPVAFVEQISHWAFVAPRCHMLPYEVVVRRQAYGSYLKRYPNFEKGHVFLEPIVEFFLKTNDERWKDNKLICDDPFMVMDAGKIHVFDPSKPILEQEPFLTLPESEVFSHEKEQKAFPDMIRIARQVFLVLEKAWELEGGVLIDFKGEFCFDPVGNLLLADAIDNDQWRVLVNGVHVDKQAYRDGASIRDVLAKYRYVEEITARFKK